MGRVDNLPDRTGAQATADSRDDGSGNGGGNGTIQELLESGHAQLATHSASARLDAQLLLAHVLQRPRSELIAHPERAIAPAAAAAYRALLKRAAAGEPLAYLTGEREFWSLPLTVTPAVLIPRPETELAVERCLALAVSNPADASASSSPAMPYRLCDLGTGSGAIALALAIERPTWRITATDQSAAALRVAQNNAARLDVHNIEFLEGDWFAPLAGRRFALIVSNPPYVAAADPALAALRYEPSQALCPGPTGLEALRAIVSQAPTHLVRGGWLVLEHGADQGAALARALVARGYARVRCHQDLAGHARITEAQWA